MRITIVPHDEQWRDPVDRFNARMREGGSAYGFYVDPIPLWARKEHDDQSVWREYYLVLEDGQSVRGGYVLKPQQWWIHGAIETVADWQGPFSEGAVSRRYGALGLRIMRDMVKRQPLLYSWGHGGDDQSVLRLIKSLGWLMHPTPFLFRVVRPAAFARKNAYLRTSPRRRAALDVLAHSGLAGIGGRAVSLALRIASLERFGARAEVVPAFDDWADALWHRAKHDYAAIAVRDAATMNTLIPPGERHREWSEPTRLRVRDRGGRTIGWAVVCLRAMNGHHRFGELTVGTIVDALAPVEHAGEIIHAAYEWLADAGAELVIANQSDPRWVRAFGANAFLRVADRRSFCATPALTTALAPWHHTRERLFLTNMDGHGPMGL
ncbi:MAG: hypothetical protein M3Y87_16115 [Myxococcota bacterium]|nr:hypothetical protein [Myxococcota bacterium]